MGGEGAASVQQAFGGMAGALTGVAPGWLCLGLALHLCNQLLRGRGWWAIVRAACDGRTRVRRREAVAAWIAGAGAAGVLTAQVGDALRVWLLSRRHPDAGYALLAGTLVAETAGEFVAGLPLAVFAVAIGVGPTLAVTWQAAAGVVAILAVGAAAAVVARQRALGIRALAQLRDGCAPLAAPRAYAASVTPWQLASRACRIAAVACFLAAFHLPVTPSTVLVVIFAQASGRVLPFAPAALGAGVVVLAATFGAAAQSPVGTGRVAAFLVGTTTLLSLMGAAIAIAVIVRNMDRWTLARAARRTPAAQAPAG